MTRSVAIIGSGPAGFYTAEALQSSSADLCIDMFERLPVPFGLVRYGVAPDHQKLKSVTEVFEAIAAHPDFRFVGNVTVGKDLAVAALRKAYDAVVVATGALSDRKLGIAGEDLAGSLSATAFVAWYNGHPEFCDLAPDLSQETAVVIGNGNVALDVCRILAKSPDELASSDISAHALEALSRSRIRTIVLTGRRGPAQASFTARELRDLTRLAGADAVIDPAELELNPATAAELATGQAGKIIEILKGLGAPDGMRTKPRRIEIRFGLAPLRIEGESCVDRAVFARCQLEGEAFAQRAVPDGRESAIKAGLVLRSIGYLGRELPGVPFDARGGRVPNRAARVLDASGAVVPGLYTAGWIRRGPSGIIGTNRACGAEAAAAVIADLAAASPPRDPRLRGRLLAGLQDAGRCVDLAGWHRIDQRERANGQHRGKPREKMTTVGEMLDVAAQQPVPAQA